MKIGFVHWDFPRLDDSSIRSWRAVERLAQDHEVAYVSVVDGDSSQPDVEGELPPGVDFHGHLRLPPAKGELAKRLAPWRALPLDAAIARELASLFGPVDWMWLSWWPLAQVGRELRMSASDTVLSWDWDSLSGSSGSAARALAAAQPKRAIARTVRWFGDKGFERRWLSALDFVTVPSPRDVTILTRNTGAPVCLVRNCADPDAYASVRATPPSSLGSEVVFVGTSNEPNLHGIRWFLERSWSRVLSALPHAHISLVGRGLPTSLEDPDRRVSVVGEVDDVRPFVTQARVVVVPVFYGAGIPNKVIEGLMSGRPTIMTRHCARTLGGDPELRATDGSKQFSDEVVRFLREPGFADEVGERGAQWAARNFSTVEWGLDMNRVIQRVEALRR